MIRDGNINRQHHYWDNLAREAIFTHPFYLNKIQKFISTDSKILDYGCGYGRICQILWGKGYRNLMGVDISPKMIRRGNSLYPHLMLVQLDPDTLWSESDRFNLVILFSVLTCIPELAALQELLKRIHQVMAPQGYLYISDTLVQTDPRNVKRYEQFFGEYRTYGVFRLPEGGIFRHFLVDDIYRLTAHFEPVFTDLIDVMTLHHHPAKGFQYFCKKVS